MVMDPGYLHLIDQFTIVFYKLVVLIVGYLIVKLGYILLKSGIEGNFKFKANFNGLKSDLVSSSPGLLFLLLGVILIVSSLNVKKGTSLDNVSYKDKSDSLHIEFPIDTSYINAQFLIKHYQYSKAIDSLLLFYKVKQNPRIAFFLAYSYYKEKKYTMSKTYCDSALRKYNILPNDYKKIIHVILDSLSSYHSKKTVNRIPDSNWNIRTVDS